MSEFEEWMEKECSVIQSAHGEEYTAAQEAWDFQQAKIDELQARVDGAMKYVSESPLKDVSRRAMINFMDILKGNKDD